MAIKSMGTSGHVAHGIMEFVIDTPDDLENLPIEVAAGSVAVCISESSVYMLNTKGEWCKL